MQATMALGHGEMDEVHAQFDALLAQADNCSDQELPQLLGALARHLSEHFAMEDAWMAQGGFGPADCHMREHAAVLKSAQEVMPLVRAGRVEVGRAFIEALREWFPAHVTHLDSALAAWICRQRLGARPLVFHRALGSMHD